MATEKKAKVAKSVPPKAAGNKAAAKKAGKAPASATKAPVAAAPASIAPTAVHKQHSFRRRMIGVVTSDKMDKTVTVEVVRRQLDPVYKKYTRERNRYKAHDELNQYRTGDQVEITEHAPISREKRWAVTRLVSRRAEA